MTNAFLQALKPYLVSWGIKISFGSVFFFFFFKLTSVSFLLFPLPKTDLTNYTFSSMLIDMYLLSVL